MNYTAEDLAALQQALATGARRVRFSDGRDVEYRSLADLRSIIEEVKASLGLSDGGIISDHPAHNRL